MVDESSLSSLKQEVTDVLFNDWLMTKFRENLRRMSRENTTEAIVHDLEALARGESPPRHLRHAVA